MNFGQIPNIQNRASASVRSPGLLFPFAIDRGDAVEGFARLKNAGYSTKGFLELPPGRAQRLAKTTLHSGHRLDLLVLGGDLLKPQNGNLILELIQTWTHRGPPSCFTLPAGPVARSCHQGFITYTTLHPRQM
jgi:hypothetical protein